MGQMVDRQFARTGWRPRHGAGSPRPGTARSTNYEPHPAGAPGLVWDAPGRHANYRSTIYAVTATTGHVPVSQSANFFAGIGWPR